MCVALYNRLQLKVRNSNTSIVLDGKSFGKIWSVLVFQNSEMIARTDMMEGEIVERIKSGYYYE